MNFETEKTYEVQGQWIEGNLPHVTSQGNCRTLGTRKERTHPAPNKNMFYVKD